MKPAIRVHGLSKRYRLGGRDEQPYQTLRESLVNTLRSTLGGRRRLRNRDQKNDFWALRDVSLDVQPGEVVGLIGRNGAGKSTLLKVLSKITEPTTGRAELRGRVGSLLEVGTGFHNELTGRENVFLNGSILGMSRREVARKFDDIVAFAEMERFLDTPVKRYSSGMYVRLAFAVAAHLDLEVLFIDEVLAVGDIDFQKKCLQKMSSVARAGRTVLFVSHNLGLIHRLCDRAVLLNRGRIQADGPTGDVIKTYLSENRGNNGFWERTTPAAEHPADVCLIRARVFDDEGRGTGVFDCDQAFRITVEYEVLHATPNFEVGICVRNAEGITVFVSLDSDTGVWSDRTRAAGRYRSTCRVPGHLLAPGTYSLTFAAHVINQTTFDTQTDALTFEIADSGCIRFKRNDRRHGIVMPVFDWEIAQVS